MRLAGNAALHYSLLAWMFSAWPCMAAAEIHQVTIRESSFFPNDLAIAPGDTVRWTYTYSGGGDCDPYYPCEAPTHTVTADDNSFSSGAPSSNFTFERQFNSPGEYRYYCKQHSQPGRDISTNMNGRITVAGAEPLFQINAGLNDAWFNPATPGQGFFINVFSDIGQMFVAWFTYDIERPDAPASASIGEPGHRWLTAFGPYADNQAVLEVEITEGGVFSAGVPAPTQRADGTLTLQFTGCNAGTLTYDIPSLDLAGDVPIQRIALDNLPRCEASQ